MTRLLLATCLLLCASAAFAKSPSTTDDPADGSAKPNKAAATTNVTDTDPATPAHPAAAPVHAAPLPTRGGAPSWHSLLPGMIR